MMEQELKKRKELPTIEQSDTFTSIEVPDIDHGGRPLSKKAIERSRQPITSPTARKTPKNASKRSAKSSSSIQHSKISHSSTNGSGAGPKKSIYDDDALDTGYVVSDGEQVTTKTLKTTTFLVQKKQRSICRMNLTSASIPLMTKSTETQL